MHTNPFTPNFGQVPMHIAGRQQEISEILYALDDNLGGPSRTSIFIGARGCGKTALITHIAEESHKYGWVSVNVSCLPGIQEDIIQQTLQAANDLLPAKERKRLRGLSIGNMVSVEWDNENTRRANWRTEITDILNALSEFNAGLLITIDEVNPRLDEMIQIASAYQLLIRENRKIAILMAGLTSEISALLNDRSVSFLRRASQYTLGRIDDSEVRRAFSRTIEDSGKSIEKDALEQAVSAIDGFPYMLQLVGFRSWVEAGENKTINIDAVKKGIEQATIDFESRVIRATIKELSDGDKVFLSAMLPDKESSKISDIEKRMRKNSGYVSRYRGRLIESGVIEPDGRGKVKFALPGLKNYLKRECRTKLNDRY